MSLVILFASAATISLMGAFARQNRKVGWVKTRKTIIDGLRQAKRDLLTIPEPASSGSSAAYAGLPIDPTEFSSQLGKLQTSLHRANQPVIGAQPASQSGAETRTGKKNVLVA